MEEAARRLVEQEGNMGFEQLWAGLQDRPEAQRLLATLAWSTGERDRRQLDLDGTGSALRTQRMELERGSLSRMLDRFTEEEVLIREGATYRFAVPLYRRWIAWRYPPDRVREATRGA